MIRRCLLVALALLCASLVAAPVSGAGGGGRDGDAVRGHHGGGRGPDAPRGHHGGSTDPLGPTATGRGGAAATVDKLATAAAVRALREGANAVDATVAAAGVLGVVEPFSAGIGGGGFMVIRTPDGRVTSIDGREESPAAMTADAFVENGTPLAFDPARFSGLSAGVPGTVASWELALERYGSWSLRRALKPGAHVARAGFPVDDVFFGQVEDVATYFDDVPATAALYLDADGTPHDVGTTQRNPDLARTYDRIGRRGAHAFYRGKLGQAIAAAATTPPVAPTADHVWRPGLMTPADLAAYEALEREPTRVGYRGLDVWGMGPPSSGGSTVGEVLNILEGYDDLATDRTRALHLELEASRYAFADRGAYVADPEFFEVPLAGLLSAEFAAQRRALIDPAKAAVSPVAPGDPTGLGAAAGAADVSHPRQSTTHLVVSDRKGTVVSYTFTIESIGGNAIVVPGYGFLLNNELTDFDYGKPGHPNAPAGSKRPRSSMSPTIVTRDGRPFLAVGSPGGSTIPGTVLQVLLERLDLGRSLPDAIAAPRAVERNGAASTAEPAYIASPEGQALAALYGHAFTPVDEIGAVTALEFVSGATAARHGHRRANGDRRGFHGPGGRVLAAAEPIRRGSGSAAVEWPDRR